MSHPQGSTYRSQFGVQTTGATSRRGGLTTLDAHMPAAHRAHKEWTPERLIHCGVDLGDVSKVLLQDLSDQIALADGWRRIQDCREVRSPS